MSSERRGLPLTGLKPRPDLSQQLSEQILELIEAGDLRPGDKLPTMRTLAQTFAVATPTLRESLRRLQAIGAVDIRHGSGIYVKHARQGIMIANPHFGELSADSILQLLEARILIEPSLAERAAERIQDRDIQRLEAILKDAGQLLNDHDAELHDVNMGFHMAIARISGNMILAQVFESLIKLYTHEQLGILAIFNARLQDHQDHLLIFDAIRDHEPALARERMESHLTSVRGVVERRLSVEHEG
jgi:GntR family transcriptional repressor for pyruvate dehydrogenase complex